MEPCRHCCALPACRSRQHTVSLVHTAAFQPINPSEEPLVCQYLYRSGEAFQRNTTEQNQSTLHTPRSIQPTAAPRVPDDCVQTKAHPRRKQPLEPNATRTNATRPYLTHSVVKSQECIYIYNQTTSSNPENPPNAQEETHANTGTQAPHGRVGTKDEPNPVDPTVNYLQHDPTRGHPNFRRKWNQGCIQVRRTNDQPLRCSATQPD